MFLGGNHRILLLLLSARAGSVYVFLGSLALATPNAKIQVSFMLSIYRFTRIKSGMLYVKPKVRLSRSRNNDYPLKLGCDCAISFISHGAVEGVKKEGGGGKKKKS